MRRSCYEVAKAPSRAEALNKPINQCLNNQRNLCDPNRIIRCDPNQSYLRIHENPLQENHYWSGYIGLGGLRIT